MVAPHILDLGPKSWAGGWLPPVLAHLPPMLGEGQKVPLHIHVKRNGPYGLCKAPVLLVGSVGIWDRGSRRKAVAP